MAYRILVVDDDPDIVEITRLYLEQEGYRVTSAGDRTEARDSIEKEIPDLILLDVMMATPTDGFDLAYELLENPQTKNIPIIMMTAMSDSPDYIETFQHITEKPWPVSVFLEKPVSAEKLITTVRKFLN
ncbi:response regulator [bacterium]|nr:response regulator [candidate division CSSED10-310 bacterium]